MNTKYLMILSSVFLSLVGIACSFTPHEILSYFGLENMEIFTIIIQVLGSLYLGFAILNWTAKANLIGGIYSKPVSLGNFMHFIVGGLALVKYYLKHMELTILIIPVVIYLLFAIAFGLVVFGKHEFKNELNINQKH